MAKELSHRSSAESGQSSRSNKALGFSSFKERKIDSSAALRSIDPEEKAIRSRMQRCADACVTSPAFDFSMAIIILTNLVVMIIEIDRTARNEDISGDEVHWTDVFSWAVLFIFTAELVLRLFAFRTLFWMDPWNIFDFIVVGTDVTVFLLTYTFGKVFPVSILRMFRLAKLARVSKVLRVFPELRLLLASLLNSISAIFWGAVLLGLVLLGWSMAAVIFIHPLNQELDYGIIHGGGCERCPYAYSSVMHSMLTFWQAIVCGDSWGQSTIPLIERNPSTTAFFVPLFLTVGMAVVSLILGLVVSVAQEAKDKIKELDSLSETMAKFEKQSHLLKLCQTMDADNSGTITQEELLQAFEVPGAFKDSMASLGLSRDDFDVIWGMLDHDNLGWVDYKRLVSRIYSMRASDSAFTLAYLKYHVTLIRDFLLDTSEGHGKERGSSKVRSSLRSSGTFGGVASIVTEQAGKDSEDHSSGCLARARTLTSVEEPHHKLQGGDCFISEGEHQGQERNGGQLQQGVCDAPQSEQKSLHQDVAARDREVAEAAKCEEPQTEEVVDETLDDLHEWIDKHSRYLDCSQAKPSTSMIDGLRVVCRDINRLRLDLKDKIEEELHTINRKEELLIERLDCIFRTLHVVGHDAHEEENEGCEHNGLLLDEDILKATVFRELSEADIVELAGGGKVFESAKGEDPKHRVPQLKLNKVATKETCNDMYIRLSTDPAGSGSHASSSTMADETHLLLKKACHDIDSLRLELKEVLCNVGHKLGSKGPHRGQSLSAMEQEILRTEAQLDLLVVPENSPAFTLPHLDIREIL